jgi:MFS family permease
MDLRIFALLTVALGGMGQGVVAPQMPELLEPDRLTFFSGIAAALMYFGIFVSTKSYGKWADEGKVGPVMGFSLAGYALTLVGLANAHSNVALFAIRFAEGLCLSGVYVSADYLLGTLSPPEKRGQWLSYYGIALSAGLLLGPLSVVLARTGEGVELKPIFGVAVLSVLLAISALRMKVPKIPEEADGAENPVLNRTALFSGAIYGYMEAGIVAVLPVIAVQELHAKPEYCLVVVILSAALSSVFWGTASDRVGARKILVSLMMLLTLGPVLSFFVGHAMPDGLSAYPACVLFGILAGGLYPVAFSWLLSGLRESHYGLASGSFARAYGMGSLLGPLMAGVFGQRLGFTGLLAMLSAGGLAGLISTLRH